MKFSFSGFGEYLGLYGGTLGLEDKQTNITKRYFR